MAINYRKEITYNLHLLLTTCLVLDITHTMYITIRNPITDKIMLVLNIQNRYRHRKRVDNT